MTCALFFHGLGIDNLLKAEFWTTDNPISVLDIIASVQLDAFYSSCFWLLELVLLATASLSVGESTAILGVFLA